MDMSRKIKRMRIAAALTQDAAARLADVSPITWSRWERGAAVPTTDALTRAARALGVEVASLLGTKRKAGGK